MASASTPTTEKYECSSSSCNSRFSTATPAWSPTPSTSETSSSSKSPWALSASSTTPENRLNSTAGATR